MTDNMFRVLIDEDVPQSKVRADDIVVAGRARVRRRRIRVSAIAAAVMVLGVAAIGPSLPQYLPRDGTVESAAQRPALSCTVEQLRAGETVSVRSMDPTGRYVLGVRPAHQV